MQPFINHFEILAEYDNNIIEERAIQNIQNIQNIQSSIHLYIYIPFILFIIFVVSVPLPTF